VSTNASMMALLALSAVFSPNQETSLMREGGGFDNRPDPTTCVLR
jgi:hypothetical protein